MPDIQYAPVCGIYCGGCRFLGDQCKGCGHVNGKPFWTSQLPTGICPLYDCCRNNKKLEHCGLCPEFPCSIFLELRDPDMSDEEFKNSLDDRKNSLNRRAKIGTLAWLEEKA
jgi:hypothetical protein